MKYVSGQIYDGKEFRCGYIGIENGAVVETGDGVPPDEPFLSGVVVPGLVDCHTHIGDAGLDVPPGMGLEELVAPPDGLKHRYLRETPDKVLISSMRSFTDRMYGNGIIRFADFRESGLKGCRLLAEAKTMPAATALGRPVSGEYDWNEVDSILNEADGIGLPSISDMDPGYIDSVADHVHRRGKMLALHVSERIREDIGRVISLEPTFIVHMTKASKVDIRSCAGSGIPVVLCPRSNAFFGSVPPVKEMIDAGIKMALGTDNAMLCSPDMRDEMRALIGILGKDHSDREELIQILLNNGREILYHGSGIGLTGTDTGTAVFPSVNGDAFAGILESTGSVLNLRNGEKHV